MSKKLIITVLFLLVFGIVSHAQDKKCNLYSEISLGVTFCTPPDWEITDSNPYPVTFGERKNGFTPNVNLRTSLFNGTLVEAVDSSIAGMKKAPNSGSEITKIAFNGKSEFTAGKLKGYKVSYNTTMRGVNLRSIQYFFKGEGNNIIFLTATMLLSSANELEEIIDDSIKTFKIENRK
jgi:hypothetical protein